ncbi:MAG: hypothetical protein FJX71_00500 [Alphaproteobacteria bacterium]|nr:hypothetical protein [Alphaproteobacteria bacterium]
MKHLSIMAAVAVLGISASFAESHTYKGQEVPEGVLDSSSSCGINIEKLEECVKNRAKGEGEGFCNDVKLYAGNKDKIGEIMSKKASIDPKAKIDMKNPNNPALLAMQLEGLKGQQSKLANEFVSAGLQPEQLGNIQPLKRGQGDGKLKCK